MAVYNFRPQVDNKILRMTTVDSLCIAKHGLFLLIPNSIKWVEALQKQGTDVEPS